MIRTRHVKMAARFAMHRLRAIHPFEVQAMLLNACNLKCLYCRCPEVKTSLLTTEQWRGIIRGLGALGTLRIKFQGGEPTMRRDFRELCAEAQRAGILTAVITNGVGLTDQPELLDHLNEIVFSLDAVTPAINDRIRGEGTHAQVVAAIDLAVSRRLPTYVNMVVGRDTLDEIEPMLAFCEARGVSLNAQPVVFGTQYYDESGRHLALSAEETRAMHRQLAEWKRRGRRLMFSPAVYARVASWSDYGQLTQRSAGRSACMAGRYYVHIEANGDVHPCVQHGATFTPKNIATDGLEAALGHVQQHNCGDCFSAYLNERKRLFALRPAALLEMARRG
jgi:MoaA/NifB/PqqE/SkfB family radical SAM enzyme